MASRPVTALSPTDTLGPEASYPIFLADTIWMTCWHYIMAQAYAPHDSSLRNRVRLAKSSSEIETLVQAVDNPDASLSTMLMNLGHSAAQALINQHPELQNDLSAIGSSDIILDSKDSFWGSGSDGRGRNVWGRTLEALRGRYAVPSNVNAEFSNPLEPGVAPPLDLVLVGPRLTIQPMHIDVEYEELFHATHDDRPEMVWPWVYKGGPFQSAGEFKQWLTMYIAHDKVPLIVVDNATRKKIGMYNLISINPAHRCLEVGGIWYTPSFQKSFANTETSYLVLKYCFETLKYRRIEWKTHHMNLRSQNAALRLGFKFEGRFRNHLISHGSRDTMWYSIIDSEWPSVKKDLEQKLGASILNSSS